MATPFRRAIVIVLDSVGIGELPDASAYGDQGSNTLGNIARHTPLAVPTLRSLGLDRLVHLGAAGPRVLPERRSAIGRMAEASPGKDSVTGHWEMMGIVLDRAFPVFPNGFSNDLLGEFARLTGRSVIGNKAASGTQIIDELGPEHMRTGALIAQENRRYARRQLIWFRKEPNLSWFDGPGESAATIAAVTRLVDTYVARP